MEINAKFAMGFYIGLLVGLILVSMLIYADVKVPVLSSFSVLNLLDDTDEYENLGMMRNSNEYEWQYVK